MRSRRFVLLAIPMLLLLAACLPQPTLRSELFLEDDSLLTGEPCEAPCWRGIVPGETLYEDVSGIITADEGLDGLDDSTEEGLLQAVWQKAGSNQYCCRAIADEDDGVVSYLFLALAPNMIVNDVLERYGDPQYVTTFEFTDTEVVVQLVYVDIPMVVSVLVGDANSSLMANSEVVATLYMSTEEMNLVLESTEMQGWNGYQSYVTYRDATPVVTPRVTLTPVPEN